MIRILKYLLLPVSVLLAVLAILLIYLSSRPGEAVLAKIVMDNFNKRFDHRLQIDSLETDIFSRIRIYRVVLTASPSSKYKTSKISQRNRETGYNFNEII
ncbi:MAG: hypothetical protein H8E46_06875 [FCB group bacterium]|nr:hypothetical protein [FCB group bacterium]